MIDVRDRLDGERDALQAVHAKLETAKSASEGELAAAMQRLQALQIPEVGI